jgi:hypothetical protein
MIAEFWNALSSIGELMHMFASLYPSPRSGVDLLQHWCILECQGPGLPPYRTISMTSLLLTYP